jgi:hypothetical protein
VVRKAFWIGFTLSLALVWPCLSVTPDAWSVEVRHDSSDSPHGAPMVYALKEKLRSSTTFKSQLLWASNRHSHKHHE